MGVVHVLMVALTSITYGWQTDGQGGVEYIVQLSPGELREIERLGEITSAIDPAVAGHVSRIRIRVGSGPLPQQIPTDLIGRTTGMRNNVAMAFDQKPIPIPALDQANGLSTTDSSPRVLKENNALGQRKTAMMKPDPDHGASGPAFQFPPSLRSPASNTVDGIRDDFDQAEHQGAFNATGKSSAAPNDDHRFAAPDSHQHPAPEFTGPQSTRPEFTGPRSTRREFTRPQSSMPKFAEPKVSGSQFSGSGYDRPMATTMSGGPSTEPTKPRDQSWTFSPGRRLGGPTTDTVDANQARQIGPRNEFGANSVSSAVGSSSRTRNGTFGQTPAGVTFPPRNHSTNPEMALDRNNSQFKTAKLNDHDREFMRQRPAETEPTRQPQSPRSASPDRRLTNDQRFAGSWMIDRDRQRQPTFERPLPNTAVHSNSDRVMRDQNRHQPNRFKENRSYPYQQQTGVQQRNMARTDQSNSGPYRVSLQSERRSIESQDPASLRGVDRQVLPPESSQNRQEHEPRNHVAAQPFFNGLLLISLVTNIYLVFWLKNLRLRFRDMVAAKRATSSNAQAS